MLFDSYIFIFCFLPVTLLGYYFFTHNKKFYLSISWLVLASLFFYGWWNPKYLVLLISSITINYVLGFTLWKRYRLQKDNSLLLFCSILMNLLFIGYFKYAYFLISNINLFKDNPIAFDPILLPLGISFFTFQKIAFLVDASRGGIKDYRFSDYCLFVTFFPQLIAGPIVQHKDIIPQIQNKEQLKVSFENFNIGMTFFVIGLFKKIVLADSIAVFANAAFNAASANVILSFWEAWLGAVSYSLQLYFDFSGYSDMAIGLAYLFGVKLPINFYSPYKSKSIIEFWRRWHMTLSSFLRDYLYIPLGGNRKGPSRRLVNLFITMLLGGLWHGANWTFVLWGALHGFYLAINHLWQSFRLKSKSFKLPWYPHLAQFVTLVAVIAAWVPFRADNIQVAKSMLTSMFTLKNLSLPIMITTKFEFINRHIIQSGLTGKGMFWNGLAQWNVGILWILFLLVIALFLPNTSQLMRNYFSVENSNVGATNKLTWAPSTRWAAFIALLSLISIISLSGESEFLYFQF